MIDKASEILEVKKGELKEFQVTDHFNLPNFIEGVICRRSDYRYGSMIIFSVNHKKIEPQIIYGTPKLEYPFDRNGNFHWPKVNELEVWEKLDGTNILAYKYNDGEREYTTFKTRLTPVVTDSQFDSFNSMWKELLAENNWIEEAINNNPNYNLSFELYGARNPITVLYDIDLDTRLLFGVRRTDHSIKPPSQLKIDTNYTPEKTNINKNDELTVIYNSIRDKIEDETNKDKILTEGVVLYAHTGGPSWRMFKAKPESIQRMHWAASGIIPKSDLWTTAINSFESKEPSLEYFIELLKEEYTEDMIYKSKTRIKNTFLDARRHVETYKRVNEIWLKAKLAGYDIINDKASTLRFMSQHFHKKDMRMVGSIMLNTIKPKERRKNNE